MSTSRRTLLTSLVATAGAAAAEAPALARERRTAPPDAIAMLYDATLCIGCRACVVSCHAANGLEPDREGVAQPLYDAPTDLSSKTKNIIKLYKEGTDLSYVKRQCMHCVDPACVNACMLGALKKRERGIVSWDQNLCIGCRYCQVVCPFNIPKFEWEKAAPKIVKCELCRHRVKDAATKNADGYTRYPTGQGPACCEVCPRQAVIYGTRDELLLEAKRRLQTYPDRYVPTIYGEEDAGGTQVLYLSHVAFEKLGLPQLGTEAVPQLQQTIQHGIYRGFMAPAALYALFGIVAFRNRKNAQTGPDEPGADV